MKNIYIIVLLLITTFVFSSCTKKVTSEKLQKREGIAYEINSNKPFTGKVIDYYDKEEKKLKLQEEYKDGLIEGESISFYENGHKNEMRNYSKGNCDNIARWTETGTLIEELRFNNKKLISWNAWHDNGNKKAEFLNDTTVAIAQMKYYTEDQLESFNAYYINYYQLPFLQMLDLVGKPRTFLKSSNFMGVPKLEKSSFTDKCAYVFFVLDENQKMENTFNIIFNYSQKEQLFFALVVSIAKQPMSQSNLLLSAINTLLNQQVFQEVKPNRLISKQRNMSVDISNRETDILYTFWNFIN